MKKLILLIAVITLTLSAFAQKRIPLNQTVFDDHGSRKQLSEFVAQDGYTLFVFWRLCCSNSKAMISELYDILSNYDGKTPIKIILVSLNDTRDASRVRSYVRSNDYGWDLIMDLNMDLTRKMNILTPPQWVATNHSGEIILEHKIVSGSNDPAIYFTELQNIKQ